MRMIQVRPLAVTNLLVTDIKKTKRRSLFANVTPVAPVNKLLLGYTHETQISPFSWPLQRGHQTNY